MKLRSAASIKREQQRQRPETLEFKMRVCSLLEKAKPEVAYSIKRDLAIMTNMPFYKDRPAVIKVPLSNIELAKEYMKFFCACEERAFVTILLKRLSCNQGQTLRKAAPQIGKKSEVWEHAIPVKVIIDELIKMIQSGDLQHLDKLLDVYNRAGQRGLTKEQDKLLKQHRTSMPIGWNWRDDNVDPLARYKLFGIKFI